MQVSSRAIVASVSLILCGAAAVPAVWAADELDTVVVSATRSEQTEVITPASITVISREEIERSGAQNVAEVLRGRSGVFVRDTFGNGAGAVIDMRGFGPTASSNTLVLVDGRRLNNASDTGAPDLSSISLNDVERIEIVRGSAGALFGNQAVGGVINIVLRRPVGRVAEVELGVGSYGRQQLRLNLVEQISDGISLRVSGETRNADNYRDNNAEEYDNLLVRLDKAHATGRVFVEGQVIRDYLELPGALFDDEMESDRRQSADDYANDFSDTDTDILRVGAQQALPDGWLLEGEVSRRRAYRDFATSFRGWPVPAADQDREVYMFTPRLIKAFANTWGQGTLTFGVDVEDTDYYLESILGMQQVDQRIRSYYVQGVTPLPNQFSLTAGARYAKVDNEIQDTYTFTDGANLDDDVAVGSLGVIYEASGDWRLFARADQNFRFAKVEEQTNAVSGPTGLETQTGISYELGAEYSGARQFGKLVVYRIDLEDEIAYDSASFANTNLDETRRVGLMADWGLDLATGRRVGVNYTYTDSEITAGSFEGNEIPLVPEHMASLFADYRLTGRWDLHGEYLAVSKRRFGGDFENQFGYLDGYGVVNLRLGYANGPAEFAVRVNNLLDEEYSEDGATGYDEAFTLRRAYFPSPERNLWVTTRVRF
ncbi:MAG TPA: TonB-dependent receptor [Thioalkalivibrio sp.]|nr:TonB-dependent receptor [Thioalkalivibrio sp.]